MRFGSDKSRLGEHSLTPDVDGGRQKPHDSDAFETERKSRSDAYAMPLM